MHSHEGYRRWFGSQRCRFEGIWRAQFSDFHALFSDLMFWGCFNPRLYLKKGFPHAVSLGYGRKHDVFSHLVGWASYFYYSFHVESIQTSWNERTWRLPESFFIAEDTVGSNVFSFPYGRRFLRLRQSN